jgi:hypothetical protein
LGLEKRGKGKGEAESGGVFAKSGGDFTDGVSPSDRQLFKTREGVSPSFPPTFQEKVKGKFPL